MAITIRLQRQRPNFYPQRRLSQNPPQTPLQHHRTPQAPRHPEALLRQTPRRPAIPNLSNQLAARNHHCPGIPASPGKPAPASDKQRRYEIHASVARVLRGFLQERTPQAEFESSSPRPYVIEHHSCGRREGAPVQDWEGSVWVSEGWCA